MIDLRSDTVTLPTPAMREAMYRAEVGDDVYGEDPTVNRLEAMAAQRMGTEGALFVASGTMANLVALLTHCGRGDEVILGDISHTLLFEAGGSASLGGIHHYAVPTQPDGTLCLEDIAAAIRPDNEHYPRTRLVCLENTHNRCGGRVLTPAYTAAVCALAHERGLCVHIDGARIYNAAIALGVEARALVGGADSVAFCLSKGLSAPVGSLLCGSGPFVRDARRWRKAVGGGMRQCGVLAAAGIVALEEMVERLAEDHANARRLAEQIAVIPGIGIDPETVETDILIFDVDPQRMSAAALTQALRARGVLVSAIAPSRIRAVTHYGIVAADMDATAMAVQEAMEAA
ncbi:MAG: low-specificity L-threonine aldolase [Anaerolineae bacterium]|nr:low-specificity L-threonine aldolase [Anaerolineae bacterium]